MSRIFLCDWCGYMTDDRDELFGLTVNDGPGERGVPNGVHICTDCFPEEPQAHEVLS